MNKNTIYLTQGAIIAALYVALTLLLAPIAYGPIQFRLSEAMTVLPILTPAAVPGLFLGCLIANLMNPGALGLIDIICGSLATLLSAWLTWKLGKPIREQDAKILSWKGIRPLLPPILVNGIVVGFYLPFLIPEIGTSIGAILFTMLTVAVSEAVVVLVIGWPLMIGLKRSKLQLYRG